MTTNGEVAESGLSHRPAKAATPFGGSEGSNPSLTTTAMRHQNAAQATDLVRNGKGPSVPADIYDLPPMAFAKRIGLVVPLNSPGNLSYPGLLGLALNRYYDRNPNLSRPLRLAS